jgi:hypothetical protein
MRFLTWMEVGFERIRPLVSVREDVPHVDVVRCGLRPGSRWGCYRCTTGVGEGLQRNISALQDR